MRGAIVSVAVAIALFGGYACVGDDPTSTPAADASTTPPVDANPEPPRDASVDASPVPDASLVPDAADAANPCPLSKLGPNGRCEPVCGVRFTLGQDIATGAAAGPAVVSIDGVGESTYGLANDGSFMFFRSSYWFAKKNGAAYMVNEIPAADLSGIELPRAGQLTSDGLSVIFVRANNKLAWGDANVANGRVSNFRDGPFTDINPLLPAAPSYLSSPAISGDGLVLTYWITSSGNGNDGAWQSRRASKQVPFPQPKRLGGALADAKYAIEGLSYDGLTAFVFDNFTTRIFTRADTGDEFTTDLARSAIPAWRVNVADRCDRAVATRSPGGAQNQQIAEVVATP